SVAVYERTGRGGGHLGSQARGALQPRDVHEMTRRDFFGHGLPLARAAELIKQLRSPWRTALRIFFEGPSDDAPELRRDLSEVGRLGEMFHEDLTRALPGKRDVTGEHLVQNHTQAVD